ncbi:MAG TPA: hypothetical protein PK074_07305 [Spirochaetales bacterium]|nr:hypothetical protein [Spirochaetales bacterium]HQK34516.1 hypothetical protein [Spirochaetales bacterium]
MHKAAKRIIIASFSLAVLLLVVSVIFSKQPFQVYALFIIKPFTNMRILRTIIENTAPLILCGLGVIVMFRSGNYSLAGEGQVYSAMLGTAVLARYLEIQNFSAGIELVFSIIGGTILAGVMSIPIAIVGSYKRDNVLLISFMLSQAIVFIVDGLIAGPLRDLSNNLVATASFAARLPIISSSFPLSIAPLIAIVATLVQWFFFEHTPSGIMLTLYGRNAVYARLQGYPVWIFSWIPVIIGGLLHGLAGSLIVTASYGRVIRGMSGGIGWNAIGIALIAANKPAFIPLAALLFTWLDTMTQYTSALGYISFTNTIVIKALILLFITSKTPEFHIKKRIPSV